MKNLFSQFVRDERAATAIEYGLIAGFVSVAIFSTVVGLGESVESTYSNVSSDFQDALSGSPPCSDSTIRCNAPSE